MELQEIREQLKKYLENGPLSNEEGAQLVRALDELIEKNELGLLVGTRYQKDGTERTLTEAEVENYYWEIFMYYEESDEHEHDHDHDEHDDTTPHMVKWWWVYFILAAIGFFVIWKLNQGLHR
ncbi:hypothetical protein [Chitinophaga agri]|uniref:Uncharacterized protein n=1 Tax=Chitinophaga agri TaxID=2703787 RepID=A0A6B9ZC73_9BACT|nr:hypothetical protein [Chitinophaga agri]QHS59349.1 hypothetical protein GWR21_07050 [Chitinophaga agri]